MKEKKGKEFPFKVPEFDKEEFVKTEHIKSYTTFIVIALGVLMALIAQVIWRSLQADLGYAWRISFLVGMMGLILLPLWFKIFRIDFSKIGKMSWLSSVFYYFFIFMGIFILLVNPPFCDATPPRIEITVLPNVQEVGGNVTIIAKLEDNVGIDLSSLGYSLKHNGEQVSQEHLVKKETNSGHLVEFLYENKAKIKGEHIFEIKVKDANGQQTEKRVNFSYSDEAIKLLEPTPSDSNLTGSKMVLVYLDKNIPIVKNETTGKIISPVIYLRANGKRINLNRDEEGLYRSTTQKWDKGSVEVKVLAEVMSKDGKYKNTIEDSATYHFIVE